MNQEEKCAHKKALARARSKRYYEKNKAKVIKRVDVRRKREKQKCDQIDADADAEESGYESDTPELQYEEYVEPTTRGRGRRRNAVVEEEEEEEEGPTQVHLTNKYTLEHIIHLFEHDPKYSDKTKKTYISDAKRLFQMTGCEDLKSCLKSYKTMLQNMINNDYSVNSKKQTIQVLLVVLTRYKAAENMFSPKKAAEVIEYVNLQFAKYKELSQNQNKEKRSVVLPTFVQYLKKAEAEYGKDSKQYLIALLYGKGLAVRDNYKDMKLIRSPAENDGKHNFLLWDDQKRQFSLFINDYKTKEHYKSIKFVITNKQLQAALLGYIEKHDIAQGQPILGKSALSATVSKMNKELGYDDALGINFYRHMRISENMGKDLAFEDRHKLAREMGHSMLTQKSYAHSIKVS